MTMRGQEGMLADHWTKTCLLRKPSELSINVTSKNFTAGTRAQPAQFPCNI